MGAADSNQTWWIYTNPYTGSLPHPNRLFEKQSFIIRHLVAHDVVGCPADLVAQGLDGNDAIFLRFLALIKPVRRDTMPEHKIGRFHVGP